MITHEGSLREAGDFGGHYTCDVKYHLTNEWYRTNDSKDPVKIGSLDVSSYAYVVLYKRVQF